MPVPLHAYTLTSAFPPACPCHLYCFNTHTYTRTHTHPPPHDCPMGKGRANRAYRLPRRGRGKAAYLGSNTAWRKTWPCSSRCTRTATPTTSPLPLRLRSSWAQEYLRRFRSPAHSQKKTDRNKSEENYFWSAVARFVGLRLRMFVTARPKQVMFRTKNVRGGEKSDLPVYLR